MREKKKKKALTPDDSSKNKENEEKTEENPKYIPLDFSLTTEPGIVVYGEPPPTVNDLQNPVDYLGGYSTANKVHAPPYGMSAQLRGEGFNVTEGQLAEMIQKSACSPDPRASLLGQLHDINPEQSPEDLANNPVIKTLLKKIENLDRILNEQNESRKKEHNELLKEIKRSRNQRAASTGMKTPDLRRLITEYGGPGAREHFEKMMIDILRARVNPSIEGVKLRGGDKGIDAFLYKGEKHVDIWQAKYFIDNFNRSQQYQIIRSYRSAIFFCKKEGLTIDKWELVLPRNFDAVWATWWVKWKEKELQKKMVGNISEWLEAIWRNYYNDKSLRPIMDKYLGLNGGSPVTSPEQILSTDGEKCREVQDLFYKFIQFIERKYGNNIPTSFDHFEDFLQAHAKEYKHYFRIQLNDRDLNELIVYANNCKYRVNLMISRAPVEGPDEKLLLLCDKPHKLVETLEDRIVFYREINQYASQHCHSAIRVLDTKAVQQFQILLQDLQQILSYNPPDLRYLNMRLGDLNSLVAKNQEDLYFVTEFSDIIKKIIALSFTTKEFVTLDPIIKLVNLMKEVDTQSFSTLCAFWKETFKREFRPAYVKQPITPWSNHAHYFCQLLREWQDGQDLETYLEIIMTAFLSLEEGDGQIPGTCQDCKTHLKEKFPDRYSELMKRLNKEGSEILRQRLPNT